MQRAAEDQAEQQGDHRQTEQHHQPPANAEPPTKHPSKQRPQAGPSVGDRGDPQSRWQQDQQRRAERENLHRQIGTGNDAMEDKHRYGEQQPTQAKRDHQESGQRAAGPPNLSNPLIEGPRVEKERSKAEAARC